MLFSNICIPYTCICTFSVFRADHSLQDVRSKIFPFKRKKIKAEDVASPDSPPNKRKERSISSLVVHTPRLTPTGSTGRRTKVVTRKAAAALHGLGPTIDNPVKKENSDKSAHSSSLPANLGKVPKTKRQVNKRHLSILMLVALVFFKKIVALELAVECAPNSENNNWLLARRLYTSVVT